MLAGGFNLLALLKQYLGLSGRSVKGSELSDDSLQSGWTNS